MKTAFIVITLGCALTLALLAQQRGPRPRQDQGVVSKLTEVVSIRERIAKNHELLVAAGRAPADDLAEVELAEARSALAQELGRPDALIAELKALVSAHERRTKWLMDRLGDRGSHDDADRARIALLEAQVRLLRAQQ